MSHTYSLDKIKTLQHHNMAIIGGFMGGYALLMRCDILANAQTMNLIQLVLAALGRNFTDVLFRIPVIIFYFAGGYLFVCISHLFEPYVRFVGLAIDAFVLLLLGFLPADCRPIVALYPIFFAMAYQWNAFSGSEGYVCSTIFSTNNIRQISLALGAYTFERDRRYLKKAAYFFQTILCFHLGVAIAWLLTGLYQTRGGWPAILILLPALGMEIGIYKALKPGTKKVFV